MIAAWDRDGEETYRELAEMIVAKLGDGRDMVG